MLIRDKFQEGKALVSFEIFPPKPDSPIETIYKTIEELSDMTPDFISVTYGAGGSTKGPTVDIASRIEEIHKRTALAHLTCLTSSQDEITATLRELKGHGVSNIMALRGDYPKGYNPADYPQAYTSAVDLIRQIKGLEGDLGEFSVGAACYPEGHPEAKSCQEEMTYLKSKVDAGADFLVTQLFFDNGVFYNFLDEMEKYDIKAPVLAGIMPVINHSQIERIVKLTGCAFPDKFMRIMDRYGHNPEALAEAGIAYATEQMIDLLSSGVAGVHIYTMNKADVTRDIISRISQIRRVLAP